jgi:two-component system LytT family sensor kinase
MGLKNILLGVSENEKLRRSLSHFLLIILTWVIVRYVAIGPYLRDNAVIVNFFCILVFLQTVFLYFFFSLFIFPNYLYKKRIVGFVLYLLVSFLVIYWTNYISLDQLLPYSDAFKPNGSPDVWIKKMNELFIGNVGWFGCFTNPKVAYWNFGFSFEIVTIYLCIQYFRDILLLRKRNMSLETDKLALERDNLALERDNLSLELGFLKSQINPHFLFNTLNSIYARTVDVDEQASDLVLKLSDLMRYSLYGANEEKVPLLEEMEYINNYLDLERYRHSQNLVDISFATDGVMKGYSIAPLLLISLVENAFKHGVNLSRKSSYVYVSSVIENGVLYFTVQNSLPEQITPLAASAGTRKSGGIGLINTRKRLDLMYPKRHDLIFNQSATEYEVMVSIKLD